MSVTWSEYYQIPSTAKNWSWNSSIGTRATVHLVCGVKAKALQETNYCGEWPSRNSNDAQSVQPRRDRWSHQSRKTPISTGLSTGRCRLDT